MQKCQNMSVKTRHSGGGAILAACDMTPRGLMLRRLPFDPSREAVSPLQSPKLCGHTRRRCSPRLRRRAMPPNTPRAQTRNPALKGARPRRAAGRRDLRASGS
ncbi:unnamed protein product [Lota lota]